MKQQKMFIIWALLLAVVALPASAQSFRSNDIEASFMSGFGGSAVVGDGEIIVGSTGQTQTPGELYIYKKDGDEWTTDAVNGDTRILFNEFGNRRAEAWYYAGSESPHPRQGTRARATSFQTRPFNAAAGHSRWGSEAKIEPSTSRTRGPKDIRPSLTTT